MELDIGSLADELSDTSSEDPYNTDQDGVRYSAELGWYQEHELYEAQKTPWVLLASADVPRPDATGELDNAHRFLCMCGTILVRPDMMLNRVHDFAMIFFQSQQKAESLQIAMMEIFKPNSTRVRREYMGQGIWGSDNWNEPWVLTFERFHVVDDARRQGWGTKLVTRILREITALARSARNTVVVLVMPAPPEREITAKTVGLSAAAKRRWRAESVREARGVLEIARLCTTRGDTFLRLDEKCSVWRCDETTCVAGRSRQ